LARVERMTSRYERPGVQNLENKNVGGKRRKKNYRRDL